MPSGVWVEGYLCARGSKKKLAPTDGRRDQVVTASTAIGYYEHQAVSAGLTDSGCVSFAQKEKDANPDEVGARDCDSLVLGLP